MNSVRRLGAGVVVVAAVTLVNTLMPCALDRTAVPAPHRIVLAPDREIADHAEALTESARSELATWFGLR